MTKIEKKKSEVFIVVVDGEEQRIELDGDKFWGIFSGRCPEGMEREVFKQLSKQIQKIIKTYRKGNIMHTSKLNDSAWKSFLEENKITKKFKQKGVTYVKDKEEEVNV